MAGIVDDFSDIFSVLDSTTFELLLLVENFEFLLDLLFRLIGNYLFKELRGSGLYY